MFLPLTVKNLLGVPSQTCTGLRSNHFAMGKHDPWAAYRNDPSTPPCNPSRKEDATWQSERA